VTGECVTPCPPTAFRWQPHAKGEPRWCSCPHSPARSRSPPCWPVQRLEDNVPAADAHQCALHQGTRSGVRQHPLQWPDSQSAWKEGDNFALALAAGRSRRQLLIALAQGADIPFRLIDAELAPAGRSGPGCCGPLSLRFSRRPAGQHGCAARRAGDQIASSSDRRQPAVDAAEEESDRRGGCRQRKALGAGGPRPAAWASGCR